MLTNNETIPVGYLITYNNGNKELIGEFPDAALKNVRTVDAVYKRIERRGFSDTRLIEICDAADAQPEVQAYIVAAARRVMGELQNMDPQRLLKRPTLPDCLRKKAENDDVSEPALTA